MKTRTLFSAIKKRAGSDWKKKCLSFTQTKQARAAFVAFTVVMGLLYVLQMNITATKGYDIRELEQQKTALQKESRRLELEAMELQSVDRLMAQLSDVHLVDAKPDKYLKTSTTAFAAR